MSKVAPQPTTIPTAPSLRRPGDPRDIQLKKNYKGSSSTKPISINKSGGQPSSANQSYDDSLEKTRVALTNAAKNLQNDSALTSDNHSNLQQKLRNCARLGEAAGVASLLNLGVDVNSQDENGMSALLFASSSGFDDVLNILLSLPIHHSKSLSHKHSHPETVSSGNLSSSKNGETPLAKTTTPDRTKSRDGGGGDPSTESDCDIGAIPPGYIDIDITSILGRSCLHLAILHQHPSIIYTLVQAGASLTLGDVLDQTPLHFAAQRGDRESIQLLLDCGASVNAPSAKLETPLHLACRWGKTDVIELLLDRGADIIAKDDDFCTPLHHASMMGYDDIVYILARLGVDVNVIDDRGKTSLHHATERSRIDVMLVLLDHAADPAIADGYGRVAADYSKEGVVLKILMQASQRIDDCLLAEDVERRRVRRQLLKGKEGNGERGRKGRGVGDGDSKDDYSDYSSESLGDRQYVDDVDLGGSRRVLSPVLSTYRNL